MNGDWGITETQAPPPPGPRQPRPKIGAWSYSRYAKWLQCPLSAYYAYIERLPEPKSEQMQRGSNAHEDASAVLLGKGLDLTKTVLSVPWITRLQDTHAVYGNDIETELQTAFTQAWEPTQWFAKDAWCRVIFDALIVQAGTGAVLVQEHKTGKPRAEHTTQASLYAAGAYALMPGADHYEITINYLDLHPASPQGVVRHTFPAKTALMQIARWTERVKPMLNDTDYEPTPGRHCDWCAFSNRKGGPCPVA